MYKPADDRYEKMKYFNSGKSGLKLPAVSLGLWHNFGSKDNFDTMQQMVFTAFDNGITHFDIANNYGPYPGSAEENFGRIFNNHLKPFRDELVISTKAGYDMWEGPYGVGGSRKYLLSSLDQSLKRIGVDYVDIFYHHCPDKDTPMEESLMALDSAVKSGKALYAGISNYNKEQTAKAIEIMKELKCPFIINQSSYSILNRYIEDDGMKRYAAENGLGVIAFCPLQQGLLTDRYKNGVPADSRAIKNGHFLKPSDIDEEMQNKLSALREIAESRGQKLSQMALSWILKDGEVTSVLIGASRPEQILENIGCIEKTDFTKEELKAIDRICGR